MSPASLFTWVMLVACTALRLSASEIYCPAPAKKHFHSSNRHFRVTSIPNPPESETKGQERSHEALQSGTNTARAVLSVRRWWGYQELRTFPLLNGVAPENMLVTDDGDRIVSLGNWCDLGYSINNLVIHSGDGKVLKAFALKDLLSPGDIQTMFFMTCYVNRWWRNARIDGLKNQLILNIKGESDEAAGRTIELALDLTSGSPVEPMQDRVSRGERRHIVRFGGDPGCLADQGNAGPWCGIEGGIAFTSSCELRVPLIESMRPEEEPALPVFPPIARLARIKGRVIAELRIAPDGHVLCVRRLAGPMQLWASTSKAILQWRFRSLDPSACPRSTQVALDFQEIVVPFDQ